MEYKNLTKDQKIPALGLGTWRMGGGLTADRSNDQKYIEAIRYAVKCGITHIDTAEIYGAGHTEEIVGEAINKFDRQKLFITTKVSPQHLFFPSQIRRSCQNSLKRLGLNYIDLYLIHWPNPISPMRAVISTLDELVKEGKIRYIGVSNFSARQLQNAQKYIKNKQSLRSSSFDELRTAGLKIVTNQVHYRLLHREPEKELLAYCQKEGIILTAYSPLEIGELAESEFDAQETVAKKYRKTPIQVALRWLIEKENVIAIPKASSKPHINELLGSLGWTLKKEDQEYLSSAF